MKNLILLQRLQCPKDLSSTIQNLIQFFGGINGIIALLGVAILGIVGILIFNKNKK